MKNNVPYMGLNHFQVDFILLDEYQEIMLKISCTELNSSEQNSLLDYVIMSSLVLELNC